MERTILQIKNEWNKAKTQAEKDKLHAEADRIRNYSTVTKYDKNNTPYQAVVSTKLPKVIPKAIPKSKPAAPLSSTFRNAPALTKITPEQQAKNQALALKELQGKHGTIASLARGAGGGLATMGLRSFLPGGNNQPQEAAAAQNDKTYKFTPNVQNIRMGYKPEPQQTGTISPQGIGEFASSMFGVDPVGIALGKGAALLGKKILPKAVAKAVEDIPVVQANGKVKFETAAKNAPTESPFKTRPEAPAQAPSTTVQPRNADLSIKAPKEQAFAKMGDIPKANSELGAFGKIYARTVDNQASFGKATKGLNQPADKDIKIMGSNARNVRGTTEYVFQNNLVDMEGKALNNTSLENVLNVSREKQKAYNDYQLHKHNIDRYRQDKPIFLGDGKNPTVTDQMSKKIVEDYEKLYPEFAEKSRELSDFNNKFIDEWTVKSGLISKEFGDTLKKMYKNYVPTLREGGVAGERFASKGLKANAGIKQAVGGNKPIMDINKSYPIMVQKVMKAARQNELYSALLDTVQKNPVQMSKWAKIVEDGAEKTAKNHTLMSEATDSINSNGIEGIGDLADKMLDIDARNGKYYVTAMKDGKPIRMEIHKDLFDGFKSLNKNGNEGVLDGAANFLRKTATNPFKALITGYNPFFAVRNITRDLPTSYIQGTENNPIKWFGNLVEAGKHMKNKDDVFNEFVALGGKKTGFFNAEKGLAPANLPTRALRKVGEKIQGFNEATEMLPRLGEYVGTVKREGGDYAAKQKGIYNAGEVTVNFGRDGDITKAVDALVPYLNPAVQGIDKSVRSLSKGSTWAKGIAAITVPTGALYAINNMTPEARANYEQLDNRTKDNYYVIPTGEGQYIKLPKSRESGVIFGSLFERLMRVAQGQAEPFKEYGSTVATNFAPMNPLESNLFSPALLNLKTNKDFANRSIVPMNMTKDGFGDARPKYLQADETTSEIARWFGETAQKAGINNGEGFSPKVIDYLIDSYTGIIGDILLPATTKGQSAFEKVVTKPFTADNLYNNSIQNNFYDKYNEAKMVKSEKNLLEDIPSDYITPEEKRISSYTDASLAMSDLRKQEKQIMAETPSGAFKEAKLREIRQQILDIAQNAPAEAERVYEEYKANYIPELSMMSEKQVATYNDVLKPKGVTPQQYRDAYVSVKDYSTNVRKAIQLQATGNTNMYDAFEIKDNYVAMGNALLQSGLTKAYDTTYDKLKGVTGSEGKKAIIDKNNFGLQRYQLNLLYEAFDVSQGVGRYERQFKDKK